jgi:hypothetical protein
MFAPFDLLTIIGATAIEVTSEAIITYEVYLPNSD